MTVFFRDQSLRGGESTKNFSKREYFFQPPPPPPAPDPAPVPHDSRASSASLTCHRQDKPSTKARHTASGGYPEQQPAGGHCTKGGQRPAPPRIVKRDPQSDLWQKRRRRRSGWGGGGGYNAMYSEPCGASEADKWAGSGEASAEPVPSALDVAQHHVGALGPKGS